MMKTKKNNRFGKVLLLMTSIVLVIAVSVIGTLAFLTAETDILTNSFQASTGISGKVDEPSFPGGRTGGDTTYTFGAPVKKDPLIQNTGKNNMYVGLKLDFYLNAQNNDPDDYVKVPYSTFAQYVDIISDAKKNTTDVFNTNYWREETASTATDSKIFSYRPTGTNAFTVVYGNTSYTSASCDLPANPTNYLPAANNDNTYPIFNKVQIKDEVNKGVLPSGGSYNKPTTAAAFADGPSGVYQVLNFKIVITGQGVQADGSNISTNDSDSSSIAINNQILADIMAGLDK